MTTQRDESRLHQSELVPVCLLLSLELQYKRGQAWAEGQGPQINPNNNGRGDVTPSRRYESILARIPSPPEGYESALARIPSPSKLRSELAHVKEALEANTELRGQRSVVEK